jgi:large subunit ribosomal protein L10
MGSDPKEFGFLRKAFFVFLRGGEVLREKHKKIMHKKEKVVSDFKETFTSSSIAIITDYRGGGQGLSVEDISLLRRKLKEQKGEYKIIKNTLALRSLKELGLKGLEAYFKDPTAIAFGYDDPVFLAKTIVDFAKDRKSIHNEFGIPNIKAAYMEQAILDANQVRALAVLPPRAQLIAMLLGGLKSPLNNFVGVLSAPLRNFLSVLAQIKEQKEKGVN